MLKSDDGKILNWSQYNRALVQRGNPNFLIPDDIKRWWFDGYDKYEGSGRPVKYSKQAIRICLQIRSLFRLTYRQTQGFMDYLLGKIDPKLKAPDYTLLQKRSGAFLEEEITIKDKLKAEGSISIMVDSTGLKIYGEGEWKVRTHGISERRKWRKLHIAIDESQAIVAHELTTQESSEPEVCERMLSRIEQRVEAVYGDGGYDSNRLHEVADARGAKLIAPPARGSCRALARRKRVMRGYQMGVRDRVVAELEECGGDDGRKRWKKRNRYHKRSLVETAFFRLKRMLGERLSARSLDRQKVEIATRISVLNKFTALGMPIRSKRA